MNDDRSRKQAGQPSGGEFAVKVRSETDVRLHAPADPTTPVTVPDPDDPFAMPIFDGPAADAATMLIPGSYTAYGVDDPDIAYLLTVPDPGAITWTAHSDGTRDAVVEGVQVTVALFDEEADPEDDTSRRIVVFADGTPNDSATFAYDWDAAAWSVRGAGLSGTEDTADQAVRAIVMAHKRKHQL